MKNNKGFTLIEILVSVSILSILLLIAVPSTIKLYNQGIEKTMVTQENNVKAAAKVYIDDYCNNPIDSTHLCPSSYNVGKGNKKYLCLNEIQAQEYIKNIEYKKNDCKGIIIFEESEENSDIWDNAKTYLYCGETEDGGYEYITDPTFNPNKYTECNINIEINLPILKRAPSYTENYLDGPIARNSIEYIEFLDTKDVPTEAKGSWDVSDKNDGSVIAWYNDADENGLYELYIGGEGGVNANRNSSYLFSELTKLETIKMANLYTFGVTNMYRMFYFVPAKELDLSSFDTSSVTDMGYLFAHSEVENVDISSFDTSNVTNMGHMFYLTNIKSLDLRHFDTRKVTNMGSMFVYVPLTELDLSSFNTSNVTDMSNMFQETRIINLDISHFDTSKVTDMYAMFTGATTKVLDLRNFDTRNVTSMNSMFSATESEIIDLSSFDTSNVTDMAHMFFFSEIEELDLTHFNTSKVTRMNTMFKYSNIKNLDLSSFDVSTTTELTEMFYAASATSGYAKTQTIADRFNDSSQTNIPSGLRFTTK